MVDEKKLLGSPDAKVWAEEFMAEFGDRREDIDEGLMIGWFANAMAVGEQGGRQSPYNDPAFIKWAEDVNSSMTPKLEGSALTMSIVTPGVGDVKFWVELGASIMMNKPLIAISLTEDIPEKLLRVTDELVIVKDGSGGGINGDEAKEAIKAAIGRVLAKLQNEDPAT